MNTPTNTALTAKGTSTLVIPPWVIALECWVNEGGGGDDPDEASWLNQERLLLRQQER